jgi:Protein of unknown function (DUF2917)
MTHSTHHDTRHSTARDGGARGHLHQLAAGAIFGLSIQRRARVTCLTGELWVTGPDTGDQILEPGQSLAIHGAGRVVVEALTPARFETA